MLTVNFAKSAAFFRTSFYSNPSKWLPNLIGMVIEKFFELTHLNFENLNQKNSTWNRIRLGWCFRWFWPNLRLAVLIVVVLMKQRLFEWKKTIVKVWEDEIKSKFSGIKKNIKIKITQSPVLPSPSRRVFVIVEHFCWESPCFGKSQPKVSESIAWDLRNFEPAQELSDKIKLIWVKFDVDWWKHQKHL